MSASAANAQGNTPASGCAGAALRVQALGHSFARTTVLEDIDLEVQAGRNVALVGPSGCGKTTLLRLCAGLLVPRTGCILNTFRHPAFVFQQPCLLPWQTALDNIALGLKAAGMRRGERHGRAHDMAQRMGLGGGDMDKYPHQLSGGMQSRVALARALVLQPDLLLLDEPFSALDIGLKTELYGLLQAQRSSVARHAGEATAVLMITHDLMEAVRLSDCILVMAAAPGRIVQRFEIRQAADLRDDDFVYRSTALLLQDMAVRLAFGLPQAGAAADG